MRLRISRLPLLRWMSPGQSWRDAALELGVLAIGAQLLGFGCFYNFAGRGRCSSPPTNSTSSGNLQRVCACQ